MRAFKLMYESSKNNPIEILDQLKRITTNINNEVK